LQHINSVDLAEAEACFRQALECDPFYGAAHSNLGVALMRQGRPFDAAWHLRYASQLLPTASAPRANLGLLFELAGQYGLAEEQLRAALRLAPDDIEVIGHLARVHVRQDIFTNDTRSWLGTLVVQDDDPAWRTWGQREMARHGQQVPE
jgi:Flp pilus assembly protein TadD